MAGQAGYKALIKVGGTPVPVTGEACTMTSASNYIITDPSRRAMERYDAVTVYIDGSPVDVDLRFVNYLFGIVILDGSVADGVMTIDYSYVPTAPVACANAFSLDLAGDVLDTTCFTGNNPAGGFRTRINGLNDVSSTLESIDLTDKTFANAKLARGSVLVEYDFDGTQTDMARGWFIVETDSQSMEVAGLLTESISLQLEAVDDAQSLKSFSFYTE